MIATTRMDLLWKKNLMQEKIEKKKSRFFISSMKNSKTTHYNTKDLSKKIQSSTLLLQENSKLTNIVDTIAPQAVET
jgi:hypothetical protein